MCATPLKKICASDHAMNAMDEMRALNEDMKAFMDETHGEYPAWKEIEVSAGNYMK